MEDSMKNARLFFSTGKVQDYLKYKSDSSSFKIKNAFLQKNDRDGGHEYI